MEIEINGKKYIEIERPQEKKYSKSFSKLYMMAMIFGGMCGNSGNTINKETPKVDIIKEFELIQQKKSKLSKSNRDWVENQFLNKFREI
jgi:hypothetical protein